MDDQYRERVELRFALLDSDADGRLSEKDFTELAERDIDTSGQQSDSPRAAAVRAGHAQYWRGLVLDLDGDDDGVVSFEEYSAATHDAEWFERHMRPYAESIAAICDVDDDGHIDRGEFLAAMAAIGFQPDRAEAVFTAMGGDSQGYVTPAAWVDAIKAYYISAGADPVGQVLAKD